MKSNLLLWLGIVAIAAILTVSAQESGPSPTKADDDPPAELTKLSKTGDVWFDKKRKAVVVDGQVCLREGQLEMFACPKGTKEHESVLHRWHHRR